MAQIAEPKTRLGPGFWPFTAFTALSIIVWAIVSYTAPSGFFLPPQAAAPANEIDQLFRFLTATGGGIFIVVIYYLVYFSLVFRRKAGTPVTAIGVQVHDNPRLEFWWTVIPTILVIILGWFSVRIWIGLQNSQGDVLTMEAVGYQFGYEFRYPRLAQPVQNEMHVPVGTPVTLHVTSRDVIHSYWVPEIRLKADMVPGLVNTLRFTPTVPGKYEVICTEYCGVLHGKMRAFLFVDTQQQFGQWFSKQAGLQKTAASGGGGANNGVSVALTSGQVDKGQQLFGQKCSACHSVGPFEQKIVGPGLGHLLSDPAHPKLLSGDDPSPAGIAKILVNGLNGPIGVMPNQQANAISNTDIGNLTAYLVSLSKK